MLDIMMAACSEPGLRATNEDALRVGQAGTTHYAVLSDGAGGHERGAEAALRVVERVAAVLAGKDARAFAPEPLSDALLRAHEELQTAQIGAQGRRRMHATAVVLWLDGRHDRVLWSHVGDSRLYRFRHGAVERLTVDDSVVDRMREAGVLTAEQALVHPLRSQLMAALGMEDAIEPHTPPAATLEGGDAFLLCTDGWWSVFEDAEMGTALTEAATPQAWLDAMAALIRSRGGPEHDNFSAVAAWARDPVEPTHSMTEDNGDDDAALVLRQASVP